MIHHEVPILTGGKIGAVSMKVIFNNREPVYIQVVRHFKEKISVGKLKQGEEIPSRRELARILKINPNTVQRAYKEMEDEQLIYTEGNSPSKVTTDEKVIEFVRKELLMNAVDSFITSIRPINLSIDEVLEVVKEKYEAKNNDEEGDIK